MMPACSRSRAMEIWSVRAMRTLSSITESDSRRSIATMSSAMSRHSLGMPLMRRSRREKLRGIIEGEDLFEGRRIDHISALATKGDTFAHGDAFGSRIVDHHDIVVVDTLDIHGCDLGPSNRLANQGEDDVAARDGASRALGQ